MVSNVDQVPQVIRQLLDEQTDLSAIRISKDAGLCDVGLQRWTGVPDLELGRLWLQGQDWQFHIHWSFPWVTVLSLMFGTSPDLVYSLLMPGKRLTICCS